MPKNIKLSAKQKAACSLLADPEFDGNIKELCRQIGISVGTFYRWWELPEFRRQVQSGLEKYAGSALGGVWKALIKKCTAGDVSAMKLYFEMRSKTKTVEKEAYSRLYSVLESETEEAQG